jgi:hypothetical protein
MGIQVVLGLDDEAPAGPDNTGTGQGEVLSEGEVLDGTSEVGDTGEDKSPLQIVNKVSIYTYIEFSTWVIDSRA